MHYEYQHAGLQRSQPSSSEQNFIKGMDIRVALDRSGFGQGDRLRKSNEHEMINLSENILTTKDRNNSQGIQSNQSSKVNASGYNEVQNSGFKQSKDQDSGFGQWKRQESGVRNSGLGREEQYERLQRSEVREYSGMRNNDGEFGAMKGSEFRGPTSSSHRGMMQGSSFEVPNQYEADTRNRKREDYYNQQFSMSSMKPSNMGQASSFQYSQSGAMQESSSFNKSSSFNRSEGKKEGVENILESFNHEGGYYKTIDIINFLAHYSMAEDSVQDRFLMHQLHRNMKNNFRGEYVPSQLEELATRGRYLGYEGVEQDEKKVLYDIYLQYLKENGKEHQLSSQQKKEQFQKVLKNMGSE